MLRFLRLSFFLHCQLWMIGFESVAPWFTLPDKSLRSGWWNTTSQENEPCKAAGRERSSGVPSVDQKSQGIILTILWEFGTGQVVFQIWVPFWKSHAFQTGFDENFSGSDVWRMSKQESLETMGKRYYARFFLFVEKRKTQTQTQHNTFCHEKYAKAVLFCDFRKLTDWFFHPKRPKSFSTHLHSCENNAACFFVIDDLPEKISGRRWGAKKVGSAAGGNVQGLHWLLSVGVEEFLEDQKLGGFDEWPPFFCGTTWGWGLVLVESEPVGRRMVDAK